MGGCLCIGARLTLAVQSAISPELPAFVLNKARELLPQDKRREFVFHRDLLGQGALSNAARWLHPLYANCGGHPKLYSRVGLPPRILRRRIELHSPRACLVGATIAKLCAQADVLSLRGVPLPRHTSTSASSCSHALSQSSTPSLFLPFPVCMCDLVWRSSGPFGSAYACEHPILTAYTPRAPFGSARGSGVLRCYVRTRLRSEGWREGSIGSGTGWNLRQR